MKLDRRHQKRAAIEKKRLSQSPQHISERKRIRDAEQEYDITTAQKHFNEMLQNKEYREVTAPELLTFERKNCAEDALKFFDAMFQYLEEGTPLFVNLSNVRYLTAGPLLYLLSLMEIAKQRKILSIRGNRPSENSNRAFSFFEQSGFYKYVIPTFEVIENNDTNVYQIRKQGVNVKPEIIADIQDFLGLPVPLSQMLYDALSEAIGNVNEHAYLNVNKHFSPNWLIMASKDSQVAHIVVLDNGETIPLTVKRRSFIEKHSLLWNGDTSLVWSALKGDRRSRTEQAHRGKGLPSIFSIRNCPGLKRVILLTGNVYVSAEKENVIHTGLNRKFHGTMWAFDINLQ